MTTVTYPLSGLHCKACVGRVTQTLKPLAGDVEVTLQPMQVVLTNPHADFGKLQAAVAAAGNYLLIPQAEVATPTTTTTSTAQTNNASVSSTASPLQSATLAPVGRAAGWVATYKPLLLIAAYILGASVLVQMSHGDAADLSLEETMRYFMAGFFLVFSFFKLLDVQAFAGAYASYDLLAQRWHGWGLIYPFVELALGLAYLAHFNPALTHWATVAVMGFSAIGVIKAVSSQQRIQCACLGTVFQLPMSTVTIVEDVGMVVMALVMLAINP